MKSRRPAPTRWAPLSTPLPSHMDISHGSRLIENRARMIHFYTCILDAITQRIQSVVWYFGSGSVVCCFSIGSICWSFAYVHEFLSEGYQSRHQNLHINRTICWQCFLQQKRFVPMLFIVDIKFFSLRWHESIGHVVFWHWEYLLAVV